MDGKDKVKIKINKSILVYLTDKAQNAIKCIWVIKLLKKQKSNSCKELFKSIVVVWSALKNVISQNM